MPAATRIGDADVVHCSGPSRMVGSPDVRVNGIPWSRQGDINIPHLLPCGAGCCIHVAPISIGSTTVFVNGRGGGRIIVCLIIRYMCLECCLMCIYQTIISCECKSTNELFQ